MYDTVRRTHTVDPNGHLYMICSCPAFCTFPTFGAHYWGPCSVPDRGSPVRLPGNDHFGAWCQAGSLGAARQMVSKYSIHQYINTINHPCGFLLFMPCISLYFTCFDVAISSLFHFLFIWYNNMSEVGPCWPFWCARTLWGVRDHALCEAPPHGGSRSHGLRKEGSAPCWATDIWSPEAEPMQTMLYPTMRKNMKLIEITARCSDYQKILHITSLPCGWPRLVTKMSASKQGASSSTSFSHVSQWASPCNPVLRSEWRAHKYRAKTKKMLQQQGFAKIPPPGAVTATSGWKQQKHKHVSEKGWQGAHLTWTVRQ